MNDPIPIACDRLECIVDVDCRIAEVLDLLHDRIRSAVDEGVAGKKQNRESVRMRDTGGRHHVERARTDRCRGHHDLAPPFGLGKANCGERHRLLILSAPRWKGILDSLQSLGQTCDVPVPEDCKDTGKQWNLLAVDDGELVAQVTNQSLGHGAANSRHAISSQSVGAARAAYWFRKRLLRLYIIRKRNCGKCFADGLGSSWSLTTPPGF